MSRFLPFIILLSGLFGESNVYSHHYKGLPHYSYFENYPQVPVLEFIEETPDYEVYITVYNFQGMNLEMVESPDDVRFYTYIFDIKSNKSYLGKANFRISDRGKPVFESGPIDPEQESIYVIQNKFESQDSLILTATLLDASGGPVQIEIPVQLTETMIQKYGTYLAIAVFFLLVMIIKIRSSSQQLRRKENNGFEKSAQSQPC